MNLHRYQLEDWFWFAARLFVGGVFAYAGFMKLMEPAANIAAALEQYPLVPENWYSLIAAVSPWVEWFLGMFLILGYAPRITAGLTGAVLVSFLVLIAAGPLTSGGEAGSCGCFGSKGIKVSVKTMFLVDFISLIICVMLVSRRKFLFSINDWIRK